MKALVAYFSASGVTAKVAKAVAEAAGADLVPGAEVVEAKLLHSADEARAWVK